MNMKVEGYSVRKPNDKLINELQLKGKVGSLKDIFEVGKNIPTQVRSSTTEKVKGYPIRKPNDKLIRQLNLKNNNESLKKIFEERKNVPTQVHSSTTEKIVSKGNTKLLKNKFERGIAARSVPLTKEDAAKKIQRAIRRRRKSLASVTVNEAGRQVLTYKGDLKELHGRQYFRAFRD